MSGDDFQEWWNKRYFHQDSRYRHFKKIADLGVNLDYVDQLLNLVALRDCLDAIAKGLLSKPRRNEIRKQKARARILGVRLVPVKQNSPPSELGLLGLLLWKYGPPKPSARGGQEDNWGTFILLAITEHFLAGEKKKPRYTDAMALLLTTRNKSLRPRRDLRQTATNRIKNFKKNHPDWKEGLGLLDIEILNSRLRKLGYEIINLPDQKEE